MTGTVKDRVILGIGLDVVDRPRQLQIPAGTDEHNIVHTLYRLEIDGLCQFKVKSNSHSSGKNLTKIRLTPKGIERYRNLQR